MRRPYHVATLLFLLPVGLIGFRLWEQDRALHGPSRGSGVVEGDEITLSARIGARLTELPVREGQAVRAGDVLARLDCADPEAQLAEVRARVAAARAEAEAAGANAEAAHRSSSAADAAANAAAEQARSVAAQRDAADRQAKRIDALQDGATASTADQASTGAAALFHQAGAADASARASGLQAAAATGQANAASSRATAAAQGVAAAEAGLARAELLVAECTVTAPRDGLVETLPFDVGEFVPPGMPIAEIVDLATVTAILYVPNAELAVAEPGRIAQVTADAWPELTFEGTVTTVGAHAEFTPRNVQTRDDRDRLVYPVEVSIPNPEGKLRPGMPVEIVLPGTDR